MNLLIVEDNEKTRRMIRSIVPDLADCIVECGDGGEALALYARQLPDYVLMDIRMKETGRNQRDKPERSVMRGKKIFCRREAFYKRSLVITLTHPRDD